MNDLREIIRANAPINQRTKPARLEAAKVVRAVLPQKPKQ